MKILDRRSGILSLFVIIGIILTTFYIVALYRFNIYVPEQVFWLGTILISSCSFILWTLNKKSYYLIGIIFILALFIAIIPFLRFNFYGTDLAEELFVAQQTKNLGNWPIDRFAPYTLISSNQPIGINPNQIDHQYFSSLSVTILPAIVSLVSGLSMVNVFRLLVPLASAFAVLSGFLVIRKIFGVEIAFLSSMVFSFWYIFGVYQELLRETIALSFVFLIWFLIFRKDRKSLALSMILTVSVAFAHYTTLYFLMFSIVILYISEYVYIHLKNRRCSTGNSVPQKDRQPIVSKTLVFFTIVVGIAWLWLVSPSLFSTNVQSFFRAFEALLGFVPGQYSYQVAHVVSSSLGPIHSVVKWIVIGLAGLGFLLALKLSTKRSGTFAFVALGGSLLLLTFLWVILPDLSFILNPDRVYAMSLLCFSAFVALALEKLARVRKKTKILWKVLATVLVVAIFLDAVGMPIYYAPSSQLSPEQRSLYAPQYSTSDISAATWIQGYVNPNTLIASDEIGVRLIVIFGQHESAVPYLNTIDVVALTRYVGADYLFLFQSTQGYYVQMPYGNFFVDLNQTNQFNQIFSNSQCSLFQIPQG
jgi:uncharacterized membrane protein